MRTTRTEFSTLASQDHERLSQIVMRKQAALSLRVAVVFLVIVLGLPLVNAYLPELANAPVFGFTASWLFLGVVFFPITWVLSAYFIKQSDRLESECTDWRVLLGKPAETQTAFTANDSTNDLTNDPLNDPTSKDKEIL